MVKKKINLIVAGFMCMSPLSGLFTVICHGADGHVAVEVAVHNHCACPEPSGVENHDKSTKGIIDSSSDHGHCNDTAAISNFIAPVRKTINFSGQPFFLAPPVLKTMSLSSPFFVSQSGVRSSECLAFHAPLLTIILLS